MKTDLEGARSLDAEFGRGIDDTAFGVGIPLLGAAAIEATGLLYGVGDPWGLLDAGVVTFGDGLRKPER